MYSYTSIYYVCLDVGIKDEGMYVCVAQNQFGTTEATGYLTVTGIGEQYRENIHVLGINMTFIS